MLRKAPAEAVRNSVENCRNTPNTNSYILRLRNGANIRPGPEYVGVSQTILIKTVYTEALLKP